MEFPLCRVLFADATRRAPIDKPNGTGDFTHRRGRHDGSGESGGVLVNAVDAAAVGKPRHA